MIVRSTSPPICGDVRYPLWDVAYFAVIFFATSSCLSRLKDHARLQSSGPVGLTRGTAGTIRWCLCVMGRTI